MKKDIKIMLLDAINNLIVFIIKISGGLIFQVNSLIADSLYTFCDFVTDIIAIIGSKLSIKKPTKNHPFGFGKVEYITSLFIGILLIVSCIYVSFNSFKIHKTIPDLYVLGFVLAAIILKIFAIRKLKRAFKANRQQIFLTAMHEARIDIFSSICVATVILLTQFSDRYEILYYSDIVGSMIITMLILRTGLKLIKTNTLHLLGEVEGNTDIINFVEEEILKVHKVQIKNIELIKYGDYYKAHLILIMNPNMTFKKVDKLENEIKKHLKKLRKIKIKFIDIDSDVEL